MRQEVCYGIKVGKMIQVLCKVDEKGDTNFQFSYHY
jgi:hypothetical protein